MMKTTTSAKKLPAVQLTWSCLGVLYRVTAWPDVAFERHLDGKWSAFDPDPSSDVFAAGALMLGRAEWKRYLEYVPAAERSFLERFTWGRLAALATLVRCPELLNELAEVPALTSFVAAHRSLRGSGRPSWSEISAVYERGGVYALLEWLGLPASRSTLEALARVEDPEIAKRLLLAFREALWNPVIAANLVRAESLSEVQIARRLHSLAA